MEKPRFQNINNIVRWFLVFFLAFSFLYGYLSVEILTSLRKNDVNGRQLCENSETELKYFKVINYEKFKNSAKVMCIYKDNAKNQYLELNFKGQSWTVISKEKINTKDNFYWPIYL